MKKRTIAIVQARIGSTRLPRKVLLPLSGKTVLERVVERVRRSKRIHDVIVATTVQIEDLEIVRLCAKKNIRVYCGSENDVLDRYYQAARLLGAHAVVRVTADCPLIDPRVIDRVVGVHDRGRSDYTSNILKETYPDGQDVEVFNFSALEKTWSEAALSSEREHVTPYLRNHPEIFSLINVEAATDLSSRRWTLDEERDYRFIRAVFRHFSDRVFGMKETLRLLYKRPELEAINSGIARNEGYKRSLEKDLVLKVKKR